MGLAECLESSLGKMRSANPLEGHESKVIRSRVVLIVLIYLPSGELT